MKRFFLLGDGDRYYHEETDRNDSITLVSGFSLSRFLEKNARASFDLLIIDGMAGSPEVLSFLDTLDREPWTPPVVLISPPAFPLSPSLGKHPLVKGVYEGPPLLSELLRACESGGSLGQERNGRVVTKAPFHGILGVSEGISKVCDQIEKYALHRDFPVLILGENGTGKELVARAVHEVGHGAEHPFVPYQASAGEDAFLASDLFGVKKGAFTGSESRKGLLEQAEGGVFFLDEIGLLSPKSQMAFLRVLEEKKIRPLGASCERAVDFRLVSATNKDIRQSVREGDFRTDLYHRINTLVISLPPLRDRKEDIPLLADSFYTSREHEKAFTRNALDKLLNYDWPGNIRELRNVVHRAIAECGKGEIIESRHILFN